jgi:hypothetical protein
MQSETDNFFHRILNYIGFKSRNPYNTKEFLISYRVIHPRSDPANILDSRKTVVYESGVGPGHCLVTSFTGSRSDRQPTPSRRARSTERRGTSTPMCSRPGTSGARAG